MGIFDGIDFENLPNGFLEDSVREDIITPLLKCLGYSSFDEEKQIIRSPHVEQPYFMRGSRKVPLTIPDYLLRVNGKNVFILEAKKPTVDIGSGNPVWQAYSYAVNPQVQVKRFALCNGRAMSVFDTDKDKPVLYFQFGSATEEEWGRLFELLSPDAFSHPHIFQYKHDYGLWCLRNGLFGVKQDFSGCHITDVAKLSDKQFSIMAVVQRGEEMLASFDFDISLLPDFMKQVPEPLKEKVWKALHFSPFCYRPECEQDSFPVNFSAYLSDTVYRNGEEDYLPLNITAFF